MSKEEIQIPIEDDSISPEYEDKDEIIKKLKKELYRTKVEKSITVFFIFNKGLAEEYSKYYYEQLKMKGHFN